MSQSDQEMNATDGIKEGAPRRRKGCFVTNTRAYALVFIYVTSLVVVGLVVHFLVDRPSSKVEGPPVTESTPTSAPRKSVTSVRLPRSVLPRHYNLRLLPVLEKGNFSIIGHVDIDVEVMEDTDKIVLHSSDIVVDQSSLKISKKDSNEQLTVHGMSTDTDREFLIIQVHGEKLKKASLYTLSMDFIGQLNDQLKGFYRSTYVEDGVEKYLATTQMEPVDARRAFPCFDEPNMKAEFSVTLGRHQSMKALSNMPLINTTPIEGLDNYYWDHFQRSVPMSTYLVAMIVADFVQVPADYDAKWKFSVYARPSAENQTNYANEIGPKILAFYEEYFGIEYPLPKQDMIAIPDFSAGAMENWGLITYRETALLYDEKISAVGNKQRVATVVAHELAHQWFGNLVTMDWWSDLWLNEGFASYVEYLGVNHVEPAFEMFQQIITSDVQDVMEIDALETSHPISVVVHHPDEINEIFDRISYGKGSSIIRMLSHFIGEKSFKEGLSFYLTSRKYGNAVQDDLWSAFTQLARKNGVSLPTDVKQIMDTWTLKMGYPVVTVERNYDQDSATVTQERFLIRKATSDDGVVYLWWVPITYTSDFRTTKSTWLANNQSTLTLDNLGVSPNHWIVFNVDEVGYFRVNYDTRNWGLIYQQLITDHTAISVISRAQIMDDALNLAQAGILDYEIALNLTTYLAREDQYLPWESTLSSLLYVQDMLSRSSAYGLFKKHVNHILLPLYEKVKFNDIRGDDYLTVYNRLNAVTWACKVGYKDCVQNALNLYHQWMEDPDNPEIISPNLKRIIVCTAIREGGEEEWNFAFQRYNLTNVASEKVALLSAMACTQQGWILAKMLEGILDPASSVRKQDGGSVFRFVASNPLGRYIAFNFLRNKWTEIKNNLGGLSTLARIVDSVTMSFNTELELKELQRFHEEHKQELATAARSTQQAIDRTQNNVLWMKVNYRKVVDWLERTYQSV